MAADTAVAASPEETLESLLREAEALKQKLEEERQKLNDVSRECRMLAGVSHCPLRLFSRAAHLSLSLKVRKTLDPPEPVGNYSFSCCCWNNMTVCCLQYKYVCQCIKYSSTGSILLFCLSV